MNFRAHTDKNEFKTGSTQGYIATILIAYNGHEHYVRINAGIDGHVDQDDLVKALIALANRVKRQRSCEWCGDAFVSKLSTARFCSNKCRKRSQRDREVLSMS